MKKLIPLILIICHILIFTGCYTTKNYYSEDEIETTYKLFEANIISHQNKAGALYYTISPLYINPETGRSVSQDKRVSENNNREKYHELIGHNTEFPFSTYSDADNYKENKLSKEIILKEKELVKSERVYSPVKTGLAIGIPVSVAVLTVVAMIVSPPPSNSQN